MKWNSTLTSGIYSYFLYCSNLEKNIDYDQISSVQLLTLVWLLGTPWLQHIRLPCPPTPGACLNSCPSIRWYDPTISSSAIPFSSGLQSFPASGSFPMSQFLASGGQSIGVSAYPHTFQWIFRTDFLSDCLIWSPCSPRDSQESFPAPQFKSINSSVLSFFL